MTPFFRALIFILLPTVAVILYPPEILTEAVLVLPVVALVFIGLGFLLWRGRSIALTLSIFIQGLNIIIRLMMFLSQAKPASGPWQVTYIVISLIAIALSVYLMLRLDQPDVRGQMVA